MALKLDLCSSKGGHGNPSDYVRKSDTMTWIVCQACKQPVGYLESIKEELMRRPDEEELQKYI
jgi:hypothetical protein